MSVANNTWYLDADLKNGKITFSSNSSREEMNIPYKNAKEMETDQTLINFIDCCKDGRPTGGTPNVTMMNDLGLFKQTNIRNWQAKLTEYEKNILKKYANELQAHSWFATKQKMTKTGVVGGKTYSSPLNYQYVLWESGLGPDKYIKHNGGKSTAISTFGSYIDPLSKANTADYGIPDNWPNENDKLILSENAMQIFGFKGSKLEVEGAPATKGKWDDVDYKMTIGCGGVACTTKDQCIIERTEGEEYMDGNGVKGNVLGKKSTNTVEKIKYIIVKEWGDKTQVLIYLLMIKGDTKYSNAIMVTCDMVVFCLCLTLNIPCVFNGESTSFPASIPKFQKGESMRRIVHYNGVVEVDKRRLSIYNDIYASNDNYIKMLETVINLLKVDNTSIQIKLGSEIYKEKTADKIKEFFELMKNDCSEINQMLLKRQNEYTFNEDTNTITHNVSGAVMTIDDDETYIQKNMAIKSIFSSRNTKPEPGKPKVLQMARGINKYCETGETGKPSFQKYFTQNKQKDDSKKQFYEIFIRHFAKATNSRGGSAGKRMQFKRGGANPKDLENITNGIVVIPVWDYNPEDLFTDLVTQDENNNSVKTDQYAEDRVWYKDRVGWGEDNEIGKKNNEENVCLDFHKLVYNKLCEWVKKKEYTVDEAYLLYWRYASANNVDVMPGLPKIQNDKTILKNDRIFFAHMDELYKQINTATEHENINLDTTAMQIVNNKKSSTSNDDNPDYNNNRKNTRMKHPPQSSTEMSQSNTPQSSTEMSQSNTPQSSTEMSQSNTPQSNTPQSNTPQSNTPQSNTPQSNTEMRDARKVRNRSKGIQKRNNLMVYQILKELQKQKKPPKRHTIKILKELQAQKKPLKRHHTIRLLNWLQMYNGSFGPHTRKILKGLQKHEGNRHTRRILQSHKSRKGLQESEGMDVQ